MWKEVPMSKKKEDEYLRRMETAVSNAHNAMKLLKDENNKLKERVLELENKLSHYEKQQLQQQQLSTLETSPQPQNLQSITRENIKSKSSVVRTSDLSKKNISFARPNFVSGNIKEGRKEEIPVSQKTRNPIQQEAKLTSTNQKRERYV